MQRPETEYPDPVVRILHERFKKYRVLLAGVYRIDGVAGAMTVVKVTGQTATAFAYFFVARSSANGPVVSTVGSYTDEFVKTDAGWLFQKRALSHDIVGDLGLARYRDGDRMGRWCGPGSWIGRG